MELNAATDYLGTNELLCDVMVEQPVEGEFTIPDYQPEIFKIVKAKAEPVVVQKLAVGSKATVDGYVRLTVIYQSGEDRRLFSLTQKLPFSKQTDLKEPAGDDCIILCDAGISYLNCRAVNQRRVDVRGAANINIRVLSGTGAEVVCDIAGDGAHQRKSEVEFVRQVAMDEKQFTLDEALAVDFEGSDAPSVLRCDARAMTENVSVEDGRVIITGNVNVLLALDISNEEEYRVKRAGFSLPFSQLIDLDGIAEDSSPIATVSVLSAGADIEEEGIIGVSVLCAAEARVFENGVATLVTDAFSTNCELDMVRENVSVTRGVLPVWDSVSLKQSVDKPIPGARLIDYFITPAAVTLDRQDEQVSARVSATWSCLLSDENGDISCEDQSIEYAVPIDMQPAMLPYSALEVVFTGMECTESENAISMKADGILFGTVFDVMRLPAVKSVSADATQPKTRPDMALSIYYADAGEDIFEIAKTFNTSPFEIAQENNVLDGVLETKSILLIPIVE